MAYAAATVSPVGTPETPKQPQPERMRDWYPYYAGFPAAFVRETLDRHFKDASNLLDPWNGSGTTTAVAAARGLRFAGFDVNPAVTIIARARLTPTSIRESLGPVAEEVMVAARRLPYKREPDDPLRRWLREPALASVRRLQRAVNHVVGGEPGLERQLRDSPNEASGTMPLLASFYYAALFAAVRDLLQRFRGTNPTWVRFPDTMRHRINPSQDAIAQAFIGRSRYLAERLTVNDDSAQARGTLMAKSVLDLRECNAFDACLTSPPYATRVDYVRSSLAELSIMGLSEDKLDALRLATTGSPRVRGRLTSTVPLRSDLANQIAKAVAEHASHGSANYYGPWICSYFAGLELSLERIASAVSSDGSIGIVVQDSYYKSTHIDLQRVVTELMMDLGRSVITREDHRARHLFSRINPAARRHVADRKSTESLLVFS